jgi:hypothetical protein
MKGKACRGTYNVNSNSLFIDVIMRLFMKKESKIKLTDYGFVALCLCVMFLTNTCANPFFSEKKVKE